MDPRKPTEVDISEYCPKGTKECSGCGTCVPDVSFKKDLGKEGHDTVKTLLITWGEKTPEEYQIDFLKRKETAINWKAGLYWF